LDEELLHQNVARAQYAPEHGFIPGPGVLRMHQARRKQQEQIRYAPYDGNSPRRSQMPITQHIDALEPHGASQIDSLSAMPNVYLSSHGQISHERQQRQSFVGRMLSSNNQDHCETGDIYQNTKVAQNEHTSTIPKSTRHAWETFGYKQPELTHGYHNPIGNGHFDQTAVEVKMILDTSSRDLTGSSFKNQYLQISSSGIGMQETEVFV